MFDIVKKNIVVFVVVLTHFLVVRMNNYHLRCQIIYSKRCCKPQKTIEDVQEKSQIINVRVDVLLAEVKEKSHCVIILRKT